MSAQIASHVIDDLMDMYVEWREACAAVRNAYVRWSTVRVAEKEQAFSEYRAALDWEEQVSALYADRVDKVAHLLPRAHDVVAA
jgi:hypothetical protein